MGMDVYQKAAQFLINVKTKVPREMICRCLILGILVDSSNEISVNATMKAIAVKWQLNVPAVRVAITFPNSRELKIALKESEAKANALIKYVLIMVILKINQQQCDFIDNE